MRFILSVLILLSIQTANATVSASVVICTGSLKGTFSLDYLRLMKQQGKAPEVQELDVFVRAGLLQFLGYFGLNQSALHMFLSKHTRPNNFSVFNVWQEASFGFDPVPLGDYATSIPAECKPLGNLLRPVLVLKNNSNNRIISFEPKIVAELSNNNPIQLQFLTSRLWLMEFTDDDDLAYSINSLWHSEAPFKDKQVYLRMQKLFQQLLLSPKNETSVCERSQYIIEAFKRTLHKNCDQISDADLANIRDLKIIDKDRSVIVFNQFELRKTDLSRLPSLRSFSATGIHWFGVALIEGFFNSAENLEHLDLSENSTPVFAKGSLPAHKSLLTLNLSRSNSAKLRPGSFEDVFSDIPSADTFLDFSSNYVETWESSKMSGLENLKRLDLSRSQVDRSNYADFSNLRSLRELNLDQAILNLNLKSSDHPHLKKLIVSGINGAAKMEGAWPQLEYLDVSLYSGNVLPTGSTFKSFPNLRFLDLSANSFWSKFTANNVKNSGLAELHKLEHLRLEDTAFFGANGEDLIEPLLADLPPSVRLVEICTQRTSNNVIYAKALLMKHMQKRPYLKVRTKIRCLGNEEQVDVQL
ncbi:hypothetical protein D3C87_125970 [compost metagenome]